MTIICSFFSRMENFAHKNAVFFFSLKMENKIKDSLSIRTKENDPIWTGYDDDQDHNNNNNKLT